MYLIQGSGQMFLALRPQGRALRELGELVPQPFEMPFLKLFSLLPSFLEPLFLFSLYPLTFWLRMHSLEQLVKLLYHQLLFSLKLPSLFSLYRLKSFARKRLEH